jgi:DNA-binding transcriptional MerR regulator
LYGRQEIQSKAQLKYLEGLMMQELGRNILLSIDQVARLTGVKKSTLRYWEKTFQKYLRPTRTFTKRREYSIDEVNTIETIKKLLEEEHLTNMGVKKRLEFYDVHKLEH